MGKGLFTFFSAYSDRALVLNVVFVGLIIIVFVGFDMKYMILGKYYYMLYYLFVVV